MKREYDEEESECPICMQSLLQPCKLKCGHIFCFLCIKGFLNQKLECALCRTKVDEKYLEKPKRIKLQNDLNSTLNSNLNEVSWFYKGYRGWWEYDARTSLIIEEKFRENTSEFEILIAGNMYIIDLENMIQYRSGEKNKSRFIRRDSKKSLSKTEIIKGKAGLKSRAK